MNGYFYDIIRFNVKHAHPFFDAAVGQTTFLAAQRTNIAVLDSPQRSSTESGARAITCARSRRPPGSNMLTTVEGVGKTSTPVLDP
jgi:hypothetical protein